MQIVIDIDESYYELVKHDVEHGNDFLPYKLLANGTPLTKGHWIVHPKGVYAHLVCDKCLSCAPYDCKTNYCPNCGADMREVEE